MTTHVCRFCSGLLAQSFCDLGTSPASNSFIRPENALHPEPFYALNVYVCGKCLLVQLPEHKAADQIFTDDYAYFSSFSTSWLAHSKAYCEMAAKRFGLGPKSQVIEIASNDGYLLQYFKAMGIPVLGVEPTANTAKAAVEKGVPTLVRFFGRELAGELARDGRKADLLLGNNVLAHVPDINDFVAGMKLALKPTGVVTMEFPHLAKLIAGIQFDTIYHEHYSYLSLIAVERIFAHHGLTVFDVDEIATHGGSLRIYARHAEAKTPERSARVPALIERERAAGLGSVAGYEGFDARVQEVKRSLLEFLIKVKREGKSVVGYGAAAKGNTLLNYCGIRQDFIDFVVDRSPAKQGRLLPGTRIPVKAPEAIDSARPDYLLILPWNLRDEIVSSMGHIRGWGGKFVVPLPKVEVIA
ncbi:MAG TPA: class I SAM-dependent methyltransferase [Hyphomicrobiaceae bacterium]|nr:class I SAM-dependent methyltransferase [Hyphomicrobiaceae bacterium]